MYFILTIIADNWILRYKKYADVILIFNILIAGLMIIRETLWQPNYSFNEYWMWYILHWKYLGYFFILKWKKIVAWFYFIMILYVTMVYLYFDEVPVSLYASVLFTWLIFPITLIFTSQKIKEMIVLLKTKKELIHTIRSILQVFPEGVIIRSVDPVTKQTVIKFANDVANQFLRQQDDKTEILDNLMVKKSCAKQNLQEKLLEEFLKEQELKIYTEKFASTSQMVELGECKQQIEEVKQLVSDINREDLEDENAKLEHYNIKSIKVQWDNWNAFMHVFVNTTQVWEF